MIDRKALTYNLLFLFLGQAASAAFFFLGMAYLARTLGPHGFGVIGFSEVVFMFFLTLSSLGTSFIGTREVVREREKVRFYVDSILTMRTLLGLSAFILMALFTIAMKKQPETVRTVIVYGVALMPASLLLDWLFQGLERMHFIALGVFARASIFAVFSILFIHGAGETLNVAYIFAFSWTASSAILILIYSRRFGMPRFRWETKVQAKLLRDSWPIGAGLLVGWVIHYFDSTVLFLFKGERAAGEFSAAYRPIILMATALTVYFNAIFPAMTRAAGNGASSMRRIVNVTMGGGIALLLPVAALGTYLSGPIIRTLYGERFASSARIFSILLWWPLVVLIVTTYTRVLVSYDREGLIGRVSAVTALLNIGLNLALIPYWGGVGASFAKIGADIVTLVIYHRLASKIIDIPVLGLAACPLIAISITAVFITFASMNLWLIAGCAVVVYGAALFVLSRFIPGWLRLVAGEPVA